MFDSALESLKSSVAASEPLWIFGVHPPEPWYSKPDWWVAGFTGALFAATLGLWIFTALLWSATKKAVADTKESLSISQNMLEHAREVSDRQLRPYVFITVPSEVDDRETYRIFKIGVKNFGQTPARNVKMSRSAIVVSRPVDMNRLNFSDELLECNDIAPQDDVNFVYNLENTPDSVIKEIALGISVIIIRVIVSYETAPGKLDVYKCFMMANKYSFEKGLLYHFGDAEARKLPSEAYA